MIKKIFLISFFLCLYVVPCFASNYTLDIINIDEVGSENRILFAYTGIQYKVRIAAIGGLYPFTWELTSNTTCDDTNPMTIDSSTGEITWNSPQSGDNGCAVEVKVTDSESNTDTESYNIAVSTDSDLFHFVDIDSIGGTCNNANAGTITEPWCDMDAFYTGDTNTDYPDDIIYFRAGTYTYPHIATKVNPFNCTNRVYIREDKKPKSYLAYPGETVIFNGESDPNEAPDGDCGWFFYLLYPTDIYFQGITFNNNWLYGIQGTGSRLTVFDSKCQNIDGASGQAANQACISFQDHAGNDKAVIVDDIFTSPGDAPDTVVAIKTYGVSYSVMEDLTVTGSFGKAISLKDNTTYSAIRHNHFDGTDEGIISQGYSSGCSNNEIVFNFMENVTDYAIYLYPVILVGTTYIYRNTLDGNIRISTFETSDGVITFLNNVIINSQSDTAPPYDSDFILNKTRFINLQAGQQQWIYENRFVYTSNLTGVTADNIIDEDGLLQGAYRTTYLGTMGWETGEQITTSFPGGLLSNGVVQ